MRVAVGGASVLNLGMRWQPQTALATTFRAVRLILLATLCACFLAAGSSAPGAKAALLSWSAAVPVYTGGGVGLNALDCPSPDQCTAVDELGREVTFDPASGQASARARVASYTGAVACPSTTQCSARTSGGGVVTFNPTAPATAAATTLVSDANLTGLSCPVTSECAT